MSVRYNPVFGIVLIVLGAVDLILSVWLMQVGGSAGFSLIIGPFLILLGILQLTRPYFEFEPAAGTIVVKALIGPATRQFGGAKGGRLLVDGNRILHTRADGRTKKVPVNRFFARGEQWQAVVAQIAQASVT